MSTALAIVNGNQSHFSREQIELIKQTIAKGASDQELGLFLAQCERTGLDPFSRQIYWISRGGRGSTQVSIDGFRVIAERSQEMDGQEVHWCDLDGVWRDVWMDTKAPAAARVLVYRKGCSKPFPGIAKWSEYAQSSPMWTKMPANQLAKCAEALALRKAFPHQLSGLYTPDEMEQSGQPPVVVEAPKAVQRAPLPEGHVYILAVHPKQFGGDVVVVDAQGAEATYPTPDRQCVELCEQIAQEGTPVKLSLVIGKRDGKTKLKSVERWKPEPQYVELPPDDNAALDAEIVRKEGGVAF